MRDQDDLHEPEHDYLLDHEFLYGDDVEHEADAQGAEDELEEDETPGDFDDLNEERLEHPAWFDDCDD